MQKVICWGFFVNFFDFSKGGLLLLLLTLLLVCIIEEGHFSDQHSFVKVSFFFFGHGEIVLDEEALLGDVPRNLRILLLLADAPQTEVVS